MLFAEYFKEKTSLQVQIFACRQVEVTFSL